MDYDVEKIFEADLRAYAAKKAAELLEDRPFDANELTAIITQQLQKVVGEGVNKCIVTELGKKRLKLGKHQRLVTAN